MSIEIFFSKLVIFLIRPVVPSKAIEIYCKCKGVQLKILIQNFILGLRSRQNHQKLRKKQKLNTEEWKSSNFAKYVSQHVVRSCHC